MPLEIAIHTISMGGEGMVIQLFRWWGERGHNQRIKNLHNRLIPVSYNNFIIERILQWLTRQKHNFHYFTKTLFY